MIEVFFFFLGAIIGSFLNVVIVRLPNPNKSIVRPRSRCVQCLKYIQPYDLIPVVSWFLLAGKCRYCKKRIAWRYPFVEFISGLILVVLWQNFGLSWRTFELFALIEVLIAVAYIDLETWLIPLSLPMFLLFSGFFFGGQVHLQMRLMGAVFGFAFFALFLILSTWALRKTGRLGPRQYSMGWGDPWLLAGIGAYVGVLYLPMVVLLASLQGIIAFVLVGPSSRAFSDKWKPPADAIVFGPFLSLAGIEVALWGSQISQFGQQLAMYFGS